MPTPTLLRVSGATALVLGLLSTPAVAQQYKMTTPIAPGVAVPDKIETSIGTLHLTDGYPDERDTVEKIYDNLDRSRALQAYLLGIPIVNQAGMRDIAPAVRARTTRRMSSGRIWSIPRPWN